MINLKSWQENFIDDVIRNLGLNHMSVENFCVTYDDMYDYLEAAGYKNFNILSGASKAAIVFEDFPFVIKIPFFNTSEWNSYYGTYEAVSMDLDYDEGVEYPLSGEKGFNYCQAEAELSDLARLYDIGELFAATEFYCTYKGCFDEEWLIYIQEKVDEVYAYSDRSHNLTRESREHIATLQEETIQTMRARTGKARRYIFPPITFCKALIDKYGEAKVIKLFQFCYIYNINDLHTSNIGYIIAPDEEIYPVLFDYSGFHKFS